MYHLPIPFILSWPCSRFTYALLAIPLRSYGQPLIIMSAIPFGIVGALLGHGLLGYNLSILSIFGIVALSGVVVNNSLLLIDRINRNRERGLAALEAVNEAGRRRFRPIILTSLTTFSGLFPMILETSVQAQFLIPMAISLGFGVLFSTFVTLLLVPTLYVIFADLRQWFWSRRNLRWAEGQPVGRAGFRAGAEFVQPLPVPDRPPHSPVNAQIPVLRP